jgi:hypothetical protein
VSGLAQGWTPIGVPDSAGGYIIDAYQGASTGTTKMYRVTAPSGASYEYCRPGASYEYVRTLVPRGPPSAPSMSRTMHRSKISSESRGGGGGPASAVAR